MRKWIIGMIEMVFDGEGRDEGRHNSSVPILASQGSVSLITPSRPSYLTRAVRVFKDVEF
jgi:hypothetical protein